MPCPAGTGASALASALAAVMGEMVARLTIARNCFAAQHENLEGVARGLASLRNKLLVNIDRDARAGVDVRR